MPILSNHDSGKCVSLSRALRLGAACALLLESLAAVASLMMPAVAAPATATPVATATPAATATPEKTASSPAATSAAPAASRGAAAKPAKKSARPVLAVPWQVSVLTPPTVFSSNGQHHLVYELEIINLSPDTWMLEKIDVKGEDGAVLKTIASEGMGAVLRHAVEQLKGSQSRANALAPGEAVLANLWIDMDKSVSPSRLSHRLTASRPGDSQTLDLDAPTTRVASEVREIGSPLRGSNWLAVNGPSNTSHHRRATLVLEGAPHTSQRYAIDWVQIGADMKSYRGSAKDNRSYLCYGSEVLAVADATVVEVKDGIIENIPNRPPAVPITLESVAGNHIDLDLGGGVYAMYAHLQPGSLRVKLGDRVKRGQVIALLGNTGNSTEPHLHFQLMDRNSPLISEGLPYALPEYTIARRLTGDFETTPTATDLPAPELHRQEIPLEMQLVNFK